MAANIPILHVLIPLIAAAFCAMLKSGSKAWAISLISCWLVLLVVINIVSHVSNLGILSYSLGGWNPPIGIEYKISLLNALILLIVSFTAAVMIVFAKQSVAAEIPKAKQPLFYSMFLLCFGGLLGMASTNDIFNIYVFLEISSLSTYTLIAMGKERNALKAAYDYLILGTIGATFFLIGVGLLYIMTGTLNISDMSARISDVNDLRPILAAFAFLTLGLGMKTALFPIHMWLVNAYTYAPSFISAFLSSTATKVSIYLFIIIIYGLFGKTFSFEQLPTSQTLATLAVAAILIGSLSAVYQNNFKKLLAFSSVAQIGYIILGITTVSVLGLGASVVHLANHALAKGALFMTAGVITLRTGGVALDNFKGVAKYMPFTMAAFVISGLSLIGIPGTAGFVSKWMLLQALIEKGWWITVIVIILSSLLAAIYIWRVVERAYFQKRPPKAKKVTEAPLSMLLPIWVFALATIYFGIDTRLTIDLSIEAIKTFPGIM